MKAILLVLVIISGMLAAGCSSSNNSDPGIFKGTDWILYEMNGVKYTQGNVTVVFSDSSNRAGGKAPCNIYSTTYTLTGSKLKLGNVISTEKACADMESENIYYKILPGIVSYKMAGGKLLLYDSTGTVKLRFKPK